MQAQIDVADLDLLPALALVGLGYVGLPLVKGAVDAGLTVRGYDVNQGVVDGLNVGRSHIDDLTDEDERKRALAEINGRLADLNARIASARVIEHDPVPDEVRFGATVTLTTEAGEERRFTIVGVDEATTAPDRVAFLAPIARAVTGRKVGDTISLKTPRGEETLTVTAIRYERDDG